MSLRPRTIALLLALLSTVASQGLAAGIDPATCCPEDAGHPEEPLSECPFGVACGCCTPMGSLAVPRTEAAPVELIALAPLVVAREPVLGPPATDIFHPPRA